MSDNKITYISDDVEYKADIIVSCRVIQTSDTELISMFKNNVTDKYFLKKEL